MEVGVIGGGVIGLCSAYYLQKAGYKVTIIEKSNLTDGCSFGNMGYVSPSHFIPLATPGMISQGMKWMMDSSSPFYVKPRINLDLVQWGLNFWKSANAKKVEYSAPHLNNLLQLSRALTLDLKQDLPQAFDLKEKGVWMLYKNHHTGEHEKQLADQAASYGLKTIICNKQEVQAYEKDVEVDVLGGVLYVDDCHLNATKFMQSLISYLQNVGVKFLTEQEVTSFEYSSKKVSKIITTKSSINVDEVVIANGSWMQSVSKMLGINISMQAGKGYSMEYNDVKSNLLYPSILVDDRVATTPIDQWLRIGGTMELSGHNDQILPKRVSSIYNSFMKYYPKLDIKLPSMDKVWFGYRPVSPDGMPYIGKHNAFNNVSFAGGHAMLGISAAAGTGKLIEGLVSNKKSEISLEAFDPNRF
jgi:D-amino-acid dehydrogenase